MKLKPLSRLPLAPITVVSVLSAIALSVGGNAVSAQTLAEGPLNDGPSPSGLSSVQDHFIRFMAQGIEPAQVTEFEVTALEIFDYLTASDYEAVADYFHPDLANRVSVDELEERWQSTLRNTGDVIRVVDSDFTWGFDFVLVVLKVEFANETDEVLVIFDESQRIIDASFPKERDTLESIANQFVTAMAASDYTSARSRFHPILKAQFSATELEQGWQDLLNATGDYVQIVDSETRRLSDVNVVLVTTEFENLTQEIFVIFDDELQILGYDYPDPY